MEKKWSSAQSSSARMSFPHTALYCKGAGMPRVETNTALHRNLCRIRFDCFMGVVVRSRRSRLRKNSGPCGGGPLEAHTQVNQVTQAINTDTPEWILPRSPHKLKRLEWKRVPVPVATPNSGQSSRFEATPTSTSGHVTYI